MVQGKGRKGEPSPRLANVHIITQQQIRLDLERGLKICKIMRKGERPGRSEKERIPRPLSDRLVSLIPTPHATSHSPPRTLQRAREHVPRTHALIHLRQRRSEIWRMLPLPLSLSPFQAVASSLSLSLPLRFYPSVFSQASKAEGRREGTAAPR